MDAPQSGQQRQKGQKTRRNRGNHKRKRLYQDYEKFLPWATAADGINLIFFAGHLVPKDNHGNNIDKSGAENQNDLKKRNHEVGREKRAGRRSDFAGKYVIVL